MKTKMILYLICLKKMRPIFKSIPIVLLFMVSQIGYSQSYDEDLSALQVGIATSFYYTASGLPDAASCATKAGFSLMYSGTSFDNVRDALNQIPNEGYHIMDTDESITFNINWTRLFNPSMTELEVSYYEHVGLSSQKKTILYSDLLFATGATQVTFTPTQGSGESAIVINGGAGAGGGIWMLPMVVTGPVYTEVDVLGTLLTPQIPWLIVHDPPGDNSYAEFIQGTTICRVTETVFETSNGTGFKGSVKLGVAGSVGIGVMVDYELSTEVSTDYTMTKRSTGTNSEEFCTKIENTFTTSDDPTLIGAEGDLYIGYGENLKWGFFDVIEYEGGPCSNIITNKRLTYARERDANNEPIVTTFMKTAGAIRADITAQQEKVNNTSLALIDRTRAANQIKVWNDILALNENNIANASVQLSGPLNSYNFDSGAGAVTRSEEIKTTAISTFAYDVATEINSDINVVATIGANGVTGGPTVSFRTNQGSSTSTSGNSSNEIKYTLNDEDSDGDNFIVNVFRDPTYGTPIFRLDPTSETSCPYEGGVRRDQPRISFKDATCSFYPDGDFMEVVDDNIFNPVPNEYTSVVLELCNDSDEQRIYKLALTDDNNAARVEAGGVVLSNSDGNGGIKEITLAANTCQDEKILIRGNGQSNDIHNFTFLLYPKCLSSTTTEADIATLKIAFESGADYAELCIDTDIDLDGIPLSEDLCPTSRDISLDFDPTDPSPDYIQIPHSPELTFTNGGDFAFETWVYRTSGGQHTILSKGLSYVFSIFDNTTLNYPGKVGLYLGGPGGGSWKYSDTTIPLNTWTHIAASVNASSTDNTGFVVLAPDENGVFISTTTYYPDVTFYVNGIEDGKSVYQFDQTNLYSSTDPLYIGKQGDCECHFFDGQMDDMAIWRRRLTQADIDASVTGRPLTGLESGLIASYDFNESDACVSNSNTTLIDKTSNYNGTLNNFDLSAGACTSNWTSGKNIGTICPCPVSVDADADALTDCEDLCPNNRDVAVHFTGGNNDPNGDYIEVPHHEDLNIVDGDFAIEAWIYSTGTGHRTILSKGNGVTTTTTPYVFGIWDNAVAPGSGRLGLYLSGDWQFGNPVIPQNQWMHVAVSFDDATKTATFYYDGVADGQPTYNTANTVFSNADTNPMFISRQGFSSNIHNFTGRIDEVAIWDKQLTTADIVASMAAPYAGTESGLVAYYDFNDEDACVVNSGNTVLTDKTNNHNGALINFELGTNCESNWAPGHNVGACEPAVDPCPSDLDLTGSLDMDAIYTSASYISSNQVIGATNSNITVDYKATTEISLLEEFEIKVGAIFQAFLDGCAGL